MKTQIDSNKLNELLNFDALSDAKKKTGKSYKEDKLTESLGFVNFIDNNKKKDAALKSVDDTCFSETEKEYLRKARDFGFESLLIDPFINEDNIEERLHIMFNYQFSILLVFDTHTWGDGGSWAKAGKEVPEPSVNGGKFYYNWIPNDMRSLNGATSSGGYEEYKNDYFWAGDHDCREALKHKISELYNNGSFILKWHKCPFIWLLNYMDTKDDDYDYVAINKKRIAMLPRKAQKIINYKG